MLNFWYVVVGLRFFIWRVALIDIEKLIDAQKIEAGVFGILTFYT